MGTLLDIMKCQVRALVMPSLKHSSRSGKDRTSSSLETSALHFPPGPFLRMEIAVPCSPTRMQLGSGSFEVLPSVTLSGYYGNWSYGGQLRGIFPLHTNSQKYRHGNAATATAWGARQINDWFSLSGRLFLTHWGNIIGSNPELNPLMSPSHRPDSRGGQRLDIAISSNLIVPTGTFAGQRLAVEFQMPVYQNLTSTQLKTTWRLILGWRYAFHL